MGLFGIGGIFQKNEESNIKEAMKSIGAHEGTHSKNCEKCAYWLTASQTGSNYYGGCSGYKIKVLANWVCENFQRN